MLMQRRRRAPTKLNGFVLLSGCGWLLDFLCFNLFVLAGVRVIVANLLGAAIGVSFVFATGRRYIFKEARRPLHHAIALYAIWNAVAIVAASWAIERVAHWLMTSTAVTSTAGALAIGMASWRIIAPPLAKIAVTPVTMYLNFVVMGVIIERRLHLA